MHLDKHLRVGGVPGSWGWPPELPGRKWGETPPPHPEKGMKMFELGQLNLFTPEKKKGGGQPLAIHRHVLASAGTGGDGVCGEELDLDADLVSTDGNWGVRPGGGHRGAYAGLVHGIASRSKCKPKVAATPATGGPGRRNPPPPRDAFAKALGAISPP